MRILFVAPVTFDRGTLFISQYVTGLARAAQALGHEVRLVQSTESMYNPKVWKFLAAEYRTARRYLRALVDLPHDLMLRGQIRREVDEFEPDVVFFHFLDTSYMDRAIPVFRKKGRRLIAWCGVHPAEVSIGVQRFLRALDLVLIYDASYISDFRRLGIDRLFVIPLGCDPARFDCIEPDEEYRAVNGVEVCFVGIFDEHRAKYLNMITNTALGIWSWNMQEYDTPLRRFYRGTIYGDELTRIYKSSKIVLNIHREFEKSGGNYRLFEIAACGSFQLVDDRKDIANYFDIGREVVTFASEQDLRDKVHYYLDHRDERIKIAHAGYERVKKDHTLLDRMRRIVHRLQEMP